MSIVGGRKTKPDNKLKIKFGESNVRAKGGKPMLRAHIINPSGWTYKEATAYAQKISNLNARKYNGRIWVNLKYKTGWRDQRGGYKQLGEDLHLWTYDDYDDAEGAVVFKQEKFYEMIIMIDRVPKKGR